MKIMTILLSIVALALAGLIGTSVGLLYAPQSGRATRALLKSRGILLQEKVREDIRLAGTQVRDGLMSSAMKATKRPREYVTKLKG